MNNLLIYKNNYKNSITKQQVPVKSNIWLVQWKGGNFVSWSKFRRRHGRWHNDSCYSRCRLLSFRCHVSAVNVLCRTKHCCDVWEATVRTSITAAFNK